MPRKPSQRPQRGMNREARFTWQPEDVTITYPPPAIAASGLPEDLHTVLWALEHVSNRAGLDEVMPNVAYYLAEHPGDPLVAKALERVEARLVGAT